MGRGRGARSVAATQSPGNRGAMLTEHSAGLVGRAAELDRVGELIDGLLAGRARGLLVVGAAGVGKTRLLEVAGTMADSSGVVFARAELPSVDDVIAVRPAARVAQGPG